MGEKTKHQMYIGGDFQTQPKHKPKVVPRDFLLQFANVSSLSMDEIIEFANNYNFGGYLIPDMESSIRDKFVKILNKLC
jgi:hypothetical protein